MSKQPIEEKLGDVILGLRVISALLAGIWLLMLAEVMK